MKFKTIRVLLSLFVFLFIFTNTQAQVSEITKKCEQYLKGPYISDGQEYRTLLNQEEVGEFRIIFYGGSTYRIAACGGMEGDIIFTVYDQDKFEIFSNRDKKNTPYWDFTFNSTMVCTVETMLPKGTASGFAMLLVGFKK